MNNLFVYIFCVSFSVYHVKGMSDEMKEVAAMLHSTCQEQSGVPEEVISRAQKRDFADEEALKCYMKCIWMETGTMEDDGVIDVDATIAMLPEEIKVHAEKPLRKCAVMSGPNACEIAFLVNKCLADESPEHYFLI